MINPTILMRHLYDAVTDFAIMTVDREARITSWNAGAREIFGYEAQEIMGGDTAVLFTSADVAGGQPGRELQEATLHGRAADYRWHLRKNGDKFWADGVMTPVRDERGDIACYLKILRDITDRILAQGEIGRLATIDSLTGLYNRAAFDMRRHELVASALRSGQKLLLFMIDLDRFKEVNDTHGHAAGDQLLAEAAERIRLLCRESDILARIGGDEFALINVHPSSTALGATLASKIIHALSMPFNIAGRDMCISGSIGIAAFPDDAVTAEELLKKADLALYEAKAQGRNCYHYFTEALDRIAHQRNADQAELKLLDQTKAFELFYQPIVDGASGRPISMEALLRIPDARLSNADTTYAIDLAKEIGLISSIGTWVFTQACTQLKAWRQGGLPGIRIAVNTCAEELQEAAYVNTIVCILDRLGLAAADVDLELTERDAIALDRNGNPVVQNLSTMGFGIVLDDFGTGYSSLSYLRNLPASALKLDKSFLHEVPHNSSANAVACAVISLARQLHMHVTAEGVEQVQQLEFLNTAGCDGFQGFLFANPMSSDDSTAWLRAKLQPYARPSP